jgi:hypothetical protein
MGVLSSIGHSQDSNASIPFSLPIPLCFMPPLRIVSVKVLKQGKESKRTMDLKGHFGVRYSPNKYQLRSQQQYGVRGIDFASRRLRLSRIYNHWPDSVNRQRKRQDDKNLTRTTASSSVYEIESWGPELSCRCTY